MFTRSVVYRGCYPFSGRKSMLRSVQTTTFQGSAYIHVQQMHGATGHRYKTHTHTHMSYGLTEHSQQVESSTQPC